MRQFALKSVAALLFGATAAMASDATPERAVCAVQQAIACTQTEPCERALPAAVNLPVLLNLKLSENRIVSRLQSGAQQESEIASKVQTDSRLVLQGLEEGAAWSMEVNMDSGEFTFASANGPVAFVAFGVCSSTLLD